MKLAATGKSNRNNNDEETGKNNTSSLPKGKLPLRSGLAVQEFFLHKETLAECVLAPSLHYQLGNSAAVPPELKRYCFMLLYLRNCLACAPRKQSINWHDEGLHVFSTKSIYSYENFGSNGQETKLVWKCYLIFMPCLDVPMSKFQFSEIPQFCLVLIC